MTNRDDKRMDALSDQAMEVLFAQAQDEAPMPSGDLLARIMADAEAEIATRAAVERARIEGLRPKQRHPLIAAMVAALGGWRAVAGLATAGVAGLAIGLGAPMAVTSFATGVYSDGYTVSDMDSTTSYEASASASALDDLVPSFYDLAAEG